MTHNTVKGNFVICTGMYLSYRATVDEAVKVAKERSIKYQRKVTVRDYEYNKYLFECDCGKVRSLT